MSRILFRERKARAQVFLNMTSLIDVLFLLLIFFMLTGTFKRVGELELQLPDSSTSAPSDGAEAHQAEVILLESGEVMLDEEPVSMAALKGRLETLLQEDPEKRVMIKAEAGVDHGEVVRMLDIVRDAGFPGVGIGTHIANVGGGGP